jgi:arsenate reductase-like glutaredoxin family protein
MHELYKHCAKCKKTESTLQKHHVFPRIHFGNGSKNPTRVYFCEVCHRKLEHIIQSAEGCENNKRKKRSKQFYLDWLVFFLTY